MVVIGCKEITRARRFMLVNTQNSAFVTACVKPVLYEPQGGPREVSVVELV